MKQTNSFSRFTKPIQTSSQRSNPFTRKLKTNSGHVIQMPRVNEINVDGDVDEESDAYYNVVTTVGDVDGGESGEDEGSNNSSKELSQENLKNLIKNLKNEIRSNNIQIESLIQENVVLRNENNLLKRKNQEINEDLELAVEANNEFQKTLSDFKSKQGRSLSSSSSQNRKHFRENTDINIGGRKPKKKDYPSLYVIFLKFFFFIFFSLIYF